MFFLYTCKCDRDFILIEDDFKTIKNPVIQCPYCGSFKVRRTGKYDNLKTIMEQERTYKMIKGRIREKRQEKRIWLKMKKQIKLMRCIKMVIS